MLVKHRRYTTEARILSHENNTLELELVSGGSAAPGTVFKDLYWNWRAADPEAAVYLLEVQRTAKPLVTDVMD